jgi:ferredoxin
VENIEQKLREEAKKLLADKKVDVIVGYEQGTLPLSTTPCFITNPDDADRLVWNVFCTHNLAKYVHDILSAHKEAQKKIRNPQDRRQKVVGIVARGCTTRSLVIHLQERQYSRDEIVILGVPCTGYSDRKKLSIALSGEEVLEGMVDGNTLKVKTASGDTQLVLTDVLADNCLTCRFNNPVISDIACGEAAPAMATDKEYDKIAAHEALPIDQRWSYFVKEMAKCIRCYACRQACPSCYCKICFVEQTQPQFMGITDNPSDTQVFQMLRIFHMVGRCVDCGSCIEVCPMGVDLRTYLKKLDKDALELFKHRAGTSLEDPPPLSTYSEHDQDDFIYNP